MISKCAVSVSPMLWRLPRENEKQRSVESSLTLEPITVLEIIPSVHPLYERITDASYHSDSRLLVALTYQSLWFYRVSGESRHPTFTQVGRCELNILGRKVNQAEATSWVVSDEQKEEGRDKLPFSGTNEEVLHFDNLAVLTERGDVYRYKVQQAVHEGVRCFP